MAYACSIDAWRWSDTIPVARDEDLAERLGREHHLLCLQMKDSLALLVAPAAERRPGDGVLGHGLEPLGHIYLHLLAGGRQILHHAQHRLRDERHQQLVDSEELDQCETS